MQNLLKRANTGRCVRFQYCNPRLYLETGNVSRFLSIVFLCTLLVGFVSAQRLPDGDIPLPPITGFSDESGVLSQRPEAARRIIKTLQNLERDHGYQMFVVLEPALISTTASNLASRLQQEWLPDGGGIVVVFESDTRSMGFGRDLTPQEGMEKNKVGVPAFSLVEIISDAIYRMEEEDSMEKYVEKLVTEIAAGLTAWFKLREAPVDSGRSLRLALITVGALSLLALCGIGVGWLMGKAEKKQSDVRIFPEIDIPERLGASYGGGGGATNNFGISEKN